MSFRSASQRIGGIGTCLLITMMIVHADDELGPADQEVSLPDGDVTESQPSGRGANGKSDWIAAPVPFSNPTIGTGLGGVAGYLFPISAQDKESPPSSVMLGAFMSSNASWGTFLGHRGYYDHDRWRWTIGGGYMNFNYTYFGKTYDQNLSGQSVDIEQQVTVGFGEFMYQAWKDIYVGPRVVVVDSRTTLAYSRIPPQLADFFSDKTHSRVVTPGLHGQYDTRNNTFSASKGWLIDGAWSISPEELGSTKTYVSRTLAINRYQEIATGQVLALRASSQYVTGDAPFYAIPAVGMRGDFRGYVGGRYRDQLVATGQGEYRWMFTERFGLAGFGGLAIVGSNWSNAISNTWLPSYGGGARMRLSKEFPISFRFDAAWGRDEHAIYFGVGEAF